MRKPLLLLIAGLSVAPLASAQGIQNLDLYYLVGGVHAGSRRIPGSDITVEDKTGVYFTNGFGYQLARFSAVGLWLDVPFAFARPGRAAASSGGSVSNSYFTLVPGARLMVPVHARVSVYGVAGFGYGNFYYPAVVGPTPTASSNSTTHGVFGFGGGTDIRLSRYLSIRVEVRDFVTGRGLSGSEGRHHVAPAAGIALHH